MPRKYITLAGILGFNLAFFGLLLSWILARFSVISVLAIAIGVVLLGVYLGNVIAAARGSVKRHRISAVSGAFVGAVFFLATVVIVNILAAHIRFHADTTAEKLHTLSPATVKLLKSLPTKVEIILFDNPESPTDQLVVDLLKEYARAGKKISFRIVDPDRNPKLAKQHDITAYGQVAVVCGEKSHTLADPDEEKITNTIKRLAFGGGKKLYFLVGHGEPSPYSDKPYGTGLFARQVRYEGLDFDTLNLLFAGGIPEDAAVICVISPKSNPTPAELGTLLTYFARGGKLFVAVEPGEADSVRGWLKNFGVRAENAMIFDDSPQSTSFGLGIEMPLITAYSGDHPITADFNQPTMFPTVCPLFRRDTAYIRVKVIELARTSENAWGDFEWQVKNPVFDPDTDLSGPLSVCFAVEEPRAKPSPRAVICGDGDFITNNYVGFAGNMDLGLNIINWLSEQEKLISIRPKRPKLRPVYLSPSEESRIFYISVVGIPFALLILAQILWWKKNNE